MVGSSRSKEEQLYELKQQLAKAKRSLKAVEKEQQFFREYYPSHTEAHRIVGAQLERECSAVQGLADQIASLEKSDNPWAR